MLRQQSTVFLVQIRTKYSWPDSGAAGCQRIPGESAGLLSFKCILHHLSWPFPTAPYLLKFGFVSNQRTLEQVRFSYYHVPLQDLKLIRAPVIVLPLGSAQAAEVLPQPNLYAPVSASWPDRLLKNDAGCTWYF